jgi:hypothetical protein
MLCMQAHTNQVWLASCQPQTIKAMLTRHQQRKLQLQQGSTALSGKPWEASHQSSLCASAHHALETAHPYHATALAKALASP